MLRETEKNLEILKEDHDHQKINSSKVQEQINEVNVLFKSKQNAVYQLSKSLEIKEMQASTLKQELEKATTDTTQQSANLAEFEERATRLANDLASQK